MARNARKPPKRKEPEIEFTYFIPETIKLPASEVRELFDKALENWGKDAAESIEPVEILLQLIRDGDGRVHSDADHISCNVLGDEPLDREELGQVLAEL